MTYRTEHPKPQFRRDSWQNLNGIWQFEIDHGNSGEARNLQASDATLSKTINVPFCPESKLSGIGYTDFMSSVWYQRKFDVTAQQMEGRIVLHFGAVDYFTTVFINGKKCGTHKGGYVSFSMDITEFVTEGENVVTVHAEDDTRNRLIPSGKQSVRYESYGCSYTRTTGIWQTVWLEFTTKSYIKNLKFYPDAAGSGALSVHAELVGCGNLTVQASFEGKPMGTVTLCGCSGYAVASMELAEKHLWELGKGGLYDLVITFNDDVVNSYFGLRTIEYTDRKFLLNGKSVFQRTILDQGFYPDGIYTAPSDAELEADIDRSMAMGFNGARLHEKIFEERFLYHADRKGYLVWGEYPNRGMDSSYKDCIYSILPEWLEEINRDFNHPSIVGWCPFNETYHLSQDKDVQELTYLATKQADPTRPCIDSSGGVHSMTDLFDVHDYEQNPEVFRQSFASLPNYEEYAWLKQKLQNSFHEGYKGDIPFFVSEYGGIRWTDDDSGWGYGEAPKKREEFLSRLKELTDVLLDNPYIMGFCYTQLTDIEQEQNGLYTYDRIPKFPPEEIRKIFGRPAAIEK